MPLTSFLFFSFYFLLLFRDETVREMACLLSGLSQAHGGRCRRRPRCWREGLGPRRARVCGGVGREDPCESPAASRSAELLTRSFPEDVWSVSCCNLPVSAVLQGRPLSWGSQTEGERPTDPQTRQERVPGPFGFCTGCGVCRVLPAGGAGTQAALFGR